MTDEETGGHPEPVVVQLTRMEGKLDRVADRVNDLRVRVDRNDTEIATLKSTTQSLTEGANASKETAVALALALKDAKDTQESTARAESAKAAVVAADVASRAALGWSPITRLFALSSLALVALNIYQILTSGK